MSPIRYYPYYYCQDGQNYLALGVSSELRTGKKFSVSSFKIIAHLCHILDLFFATRGFLSLFHLIFTSIWARNAANSHPLLVKFKCLEIFPNVTVPSVITRIYKDWCFQVSELGHKSSILSLEWASPQFSIFIGSVIVKWFYGQILVIYCLKWDGSGSGGADLSILVINI